MPTGQLIFPVLWSLLSCCRRHNKVRVRVPVGASPLSHNICFEEVELGVARTFSACPPCDAETNCLPVQKEILHRRIKITFESELQLQFPPLFCCAAAVFRYKWLCKLYIVLCFVQQSILHNNMCVYIFLYISHCFYILYILM